MQSPGYSAGGSVLFLEAVFGISQLKSAKTVWK